MSHALLAPSSADQWFYCNGSVLLNSMIQQPDGPEAAEGTAAHWVAEQILQDAVANEAVSNASWEHLLGNADPAGTLLTKEMIAGAKLYADHIHGLNISFANYNIERHVQIPRIHEQCAGTPDFWGIEPKPIGERPILHIVDFKFGFGNVEIFENKQLICYFCGIIDELNIADTELKVVFHIVQPRCFSGDGPVKTWEVKASDLRGIVNQLSTAAHKALGESPEVVSGNQCKHCPARHSCESSRQAAAAAIEFRNTATPNPLTDQALAYELPALDNAIKALQYRKDSLEDEAAARMAAGRSLIGLGMKQKFGNRAWTQSTEAIQGLGTMLNSNLTADPKLVSPLEAEKRIKAANPKMTAKEIKEMLSGLAEKPSRGMKISYNTGEEARKVFSQ